MSRTARLLRLARVDRRLHALAIVLGCLLGATALVGVSLAGRQTAARTEEQARVPLRQLTASEAAFLLRDGAVQAGHAAVVALDEDTVSLASLDYVLDETSRPEPGLHHGMGATRANWSSNSTLYELDRKALEAELGRPLGADEIDATFLDRYPVSLQPSRVWLYALSEIAFLTIWWSSYVLGLIAGLRRMPGLFVWLAGLAAWLVAPCVFVWFYSPTFYNGDFFYQRIVVESIAEFLLMPLLMGMWLVLLLLVCALMVKFISHLQRAHARGGARRSVRLLAIYMGGFTLLVVAYERLGSEMVRRRCADELAHVEARIGTGSMLASLLEQRSVLPRSGDQLPRDTSVPLPARLPAPAQAAVEELLASSGRPGSGQFEVIVVVPTGDGPNENLVLRHYGYRYADIRVLDPSFATAPLVAQLRRDAAVSTSPQPGPTFSEQACGKQAVLARRNGDGRPQVLAPPTVATVHSGALPRSDRRNVSVGGPGFRAPERKSTCSCRASGDGSDFSTWPPWRWHPTKEKDHEIHSDDARQAGDRRLGHLQVEARRDQSARGVLA